MKYSWKRKSLWSKDSQDLYRFDILSQTSSNCRYMHKYLVSTVQCKHHMPRVHLNAYVQHILALATHVWCVRSFRVKLDTHKRILHIQNYQSQIPHWLNWFSF